MAEVFLVRRTGLGAFERLLALKRVLPAHEHDDRYVAMFLEEARLAARLRHPNIGQIFEVDRDARGLYYVMEYVEGPSVAELFRAFAKAKTRLPVGVVAFIIERAARGLHHAHELRTDDGREVGLVHRDVSPSNILVGINGEVKVVDFGIARAVDREIATESGQLKGKYSYMSPEQCRAAALDRRSDVFSLGVIFHELLTSRRLFRQGERALYLLLDEIVNGRIVPPSTSCPDLDPELDIIVGRATATNREERYANCEQFADAVRNWIRAKNIVADAVALSTAVRSIYVPPVVPKVGEQETKRIVVVNDTSVGATTKRAAIPQSFAEASESSLTSRPTHVSPLLEPQAPHRRRYGIAAGMTLVMAAGAAAWIGLSAPTLATPAHDPVPPESRQTSAPVPVDAAVVSGPAPNVPIPDAAPSVPVPVDAALASGPAPKVSTPTRKKSRKGKPARPAPEAAAGSGLEVKPAVDDKDVLFRTYDDGSAGSDSPKR